MSCPLGLTEKGTRLEELTSGWILHLEMGRSTSECQFDLGPLPFLQRFTASYRQEVSCWMQPKVGAALRELPSETQFMLAQMEQGGYLLLLPLVDSVVRCSLMGNAEDHLNLLVETGDLQTTVPPCRLLFIGIGESPYELIEKSFATVAEHLGTFRLRQQKVKPDFIDHYGWCSWNAFYDKVDHSKLMGALQRYSDHGVMPGFIILDDGWQSMNNGMLTGFDADEQKFPLGIQASVRQLKEQLGLKYFMVWQVFNGYWRGLDPNSMDRYQVSLRTLQPPERFLPPSQLVNTPETQTPPVVRFYPDNISDKPFGFPQQGLGQFLLDYHQYLQQQGVDGVKVDAMTWIEFFGHGYGGRVAQMQEMLSSLEGSTSQHLSGHLLNCSSCSNDFLFNAQKANLTRTSPDFFPNRPETHGLHIWTNAHVSLWMAEVVHPDWDMFQSGHTAGGFHAAARAISGGPIYSSDEVGKEDFELLGKLMLFDGTIPRCVQPAKLCRESIFVDPSKDLAPIKLYNHNQLGAVVGVFNCCWDAAKPIEVTGEVGPKDIDNLEGELFACYAVNSDSLSVLGHQQKKEIRLPQLGWEIFTMMPIRKGFAPIGLINKFNPGGTIESYEDQEVCTVHLRDGGQFLAYSEFTPLAIYANKNDAAYTYNHVNRRLQVELPAGRRHVLEIFFYKKILDTKSQQYKAKDVHVLV